MVITGLLSANYREHHLRHELDQLPFDDWIQRDVLLAGENELKLLHSVPPALFQEQSHLALSSLDTVPTPLTALGNSCSIWHGERCRIRMRMAEPFIEEIYVMFRFADDLL